MVNQLRDLTRRYLANEIAYAEFRREFVREFSAAADADSLVESLFNAIESACAAFEHRHLPDEVAFKVRLSAIVPKPMFGASAMSENVFRFDADVVYTTMTMQLGRVIVRPLAVNSIAAFNGISSGSSAEPDVELEEAN